MNHRGGGFGLAGKTFAGFLIASQLWSHDLDRHNSVERRVDGFEHNSHAADTDDSSHFVVSETPQVLRVIGWGKLVQDILHRNGRLPKMVDSRRGTIRRACDVVLRRLQVCPQFIPQFRGGSSLIEILSAIVTRIQVLDQITALKSILVRIQELIQLDSCRFAIFH